MAPAALIKMIERVTGLTGDDLDAFVASEQGGWAVSGDDHLRERVAAWKKSPEEEQ